MNLKPNNTEIGLLIAFIALMLLKLILPDWLVFLGTVSLARGLVSLGLLILWRNWNCSSSTG